MTKAERAKKVAAIRPILSWLHSRMDKITDPEYPGTKEEFLDAAEQAWSELKKDKLVK